MKKGSTEGMEKKEPSSIAGGNVNWYSRHRKQYGGSLKNYNRGTACVCARVCACLDSQLCPTLCDPLDCNPPGSYVHVHGISPGKNTRVGCHFLLQEIFPIQELNPYLPCLLHCRWFLYLLSHGGGPRATI